MPQYNLTVNGTQRSVDAPADMPLLWVLRDLLGMTGTKYGCGEGVCGACSILEGREIVRACQIPIAEAAHRSFITIEGLATASGEGVQAAWVDADIAHCGYCQPGMLMAAHALLMRGERIYEAQIADALGGNICRCGSYPRIVRTLMSLTEKSRRP